MRLVFLRLKSLFLTLIAFTLVTIFLYIIHLATWTPLQAKERHIILFYTPMFGKRTWFSYKEGHVNYNGRICASEACLATYNKTLFWDAHVVVFHARDMPDIDELEVLNIARPDSQLWCYFNMENPINSNSTLYISRFFNISASYHQDSTIFMPYARFTKLPKDAPTRVNTNFASGKSKMVAWVVSNCDVPIRDGLVKRLQDAGVEIFVAGKCSKYWKNQFHCNDTTCSSELRQFKFYLALENSFCEDYITFKYYRNSLEHNLIPIVLGGADYRDQRLVMPNSYINVQDFISIEHLASHIKFVANNDTLFNSYFQWRYEYRMDVYDWIQDLSCKLCSISWDGLQSNSNISKVYDISKCSGRNSSMKAILRKHPARFIRREDIS